MESEENLKTNKSESSYENELWIENEFREYQEDFSLSEDNLMKPILDVGTNRGEFIHYLRDKLGNKDAFGVDIEINHANEFSSDGMVVGDGLNLPFSDDTFEFVTARNFVPMFKRRDSLSLLRELLRVTKRGGKLIFNHMTEDNLHNYYEESKRGGFEVGWVKGEIPLTQKFFKDLEKLKDEGVEITPIPTSKTRTTFELKKL